MGLFGMGDNKEQHMKAVQEYLIEGEELLATYGLLIDFAALTNKRIIFVDKTLLSNSSAVISLPYKSIEAVSIEKGKTFSMSNKIEIITKGKVHELEFLKGADVMGFYKKLMSMLLK